MENTVLGCLTSILRHERQIPNYIALHKSSLKSTEAWYGRGTFHVLNLMQMTSNKELSSLTLGLPT